MNCDQFARQMHRDLDLRMSLEEDSELMQHARQCESCRAQMDGWRQIAEAIPCRVPRRRETTSATARVAYVAVAAGLAAALLSPLILARGKKQPIEAVAAEASAAHVTGAGLSKIEPQPTELAAGLRGNGTQPTGPEAGAHGSSTGTFSRFQAATVLAQATGEVDPTLWWRRVQDRDWVGQTMPTVRSLREGVAPLGRSLMRAVTILTIGGRDQTS